MSNMANPSLIQSLKPGGRRAQEEDAAADQELDDALLRLSRAFDENDAAAQGLRRRQSSGSLKLVSIPAAVGDDAE